MAKSRQGLADRRRALGLRQTELAAASGVEQSYISRIERGERVPARDVREKLARALGVDAARIAWPEAVAAGEARS